MIGALGTGELSLIFFILLCLFGVKRLPAMGQSIRKSISSFKKGLKDSNQ